MVHHSTYIYEIKPQGLDKGKIWKSLKILNE